jgi:hypothetical protein
MNAGHPLPLTPDIILIKGDARSMRSERPIVLSPAAPIAPTPAVMTARKMVAACRENARFLRHHLDRYGFWLKLPPVVDDVLYLAYTVTVKTSAPFSAADLGRRLAVAGIETASAFTFVSPSPETAETTTLCLPCHHTLSILDLQYLTETITDYFAECNRKEKPPTSDL